MVEYDGMIDELRDYWSTQLCTQVFKKVNSHTSSRLKVVRAKVKNFAIQCDRALREGSLYYFVRVIKGAIIVKKLKQGRTPSLVNDKCGRLVGQHASRSTIPFGNLDKSPWFRLHHVASFYWHRY